MPVDPLRAAVLAGQPLPGEWIIDSHAHLGVWFNFYIPPSSLDDYVGLMDRLGIQVSCVTGIPAIGPQSHQGNALVAEAVARYPRRFVAYCTVNPHRPEEAKEELENWHMPLVKFHPATHQYPLDGPGYEPALRFAERHRATILIHVWQGDYNCEPERLGRLAEKYPAVNFIAGHSGGTEKGFHQCVELACRFANIYLDPTGSQVYAGSVETLAAGPGPDRVLLGTDMGFLDPRPQIGRIVFARLPEPVRGQILGQNMRRLLLQARLLPGPMRDWLEKE
ncbi:MAG: amidohydrolase family protein [Anaerolineae bacterium]|nr:amidohydrolase family protein [Anaerolineae bacterium]